MSLIESVLIFLSISEKIIFDFTIFTGFFIFFNKLYSLYSKTVDLFL